MNFVFNVSFLIAFICLNILSVLGNDSIKSSPSISLTSDNATGAAVDSNYVLQPSDVIQIEVFQEDDLEKTVRIEGDGTVSLALIGKIKVAGLTISEAKTKVTDLYNRDYLVEPQISIIVVTFSPKTCLMASQHS